MDLALINQQRLICHKTQTSQPYIMLRYLEVLPIKFIQRICNWPQPRPLQQAFSTVSFFKFINAAIILAFSSFLVLHGAFLVLYSTALTGFSYSCGMAQSPVALCRVFQQPTSQYGLVLLPLDS